MEEASILNPSQNGQPKKFSGRYSPEKQSLGTKIEDTTKLKQAEDASLIDEIPFKTLIDLAPVAISISRNGIGIYANLKFLNLFGLQSLAEYIGRQTYEFFAPQCQAEMKEFIRRRSVDLPVPKEYETIALRADGSQFPMQIVVDRVNLADGPANIAFATDISERRQAAEALRESELRYRSIFEGVQDAVFVEALDGRILDANPSACEMFGYAHEQFLTKKVANLVPSEDKIVPFNLIEAFNLPLHPIETVNVRANGQEFPVELTIRLQNYNGQQVYYVVLRDISQRKQAEEALQLSEQSALRAAEQLQMVHQMSATIAAGLDQKQIFQRLYEQCQQIGDTDTFYVALYDEATWRLSFPFYYINGEPQADTWRDIREMPGLSGYIIQHRCPLYSPDMTTSLTKYSPIHQPGDQVQSFIGVPLILNEQVVGVLSMQSNRPNAYLPEQIHMLELLATQAAIAIQKARLFEEAQHEIFVRKRAEAELKQSRQQLRAFSQHLQAAREEERASIARKIHDELGQQLTALKMDLAWLTGHILPEQVPLIQRAATMSEMIDSTVQTVRRVASELRPGMLDDLGLAAALEWQAGEFQSRNGILCKLVLPREVVEIERDQAIALFRIFQEALTNVSRHSRASKVRIVLKVQADRIDLAIRDNGIGITDRQIRDPHSLGLTGMRERVHVFGGKLQFKNEAGKGTMVCVAMPLVKKKLEKEP